MTNKIKIGWSSVDITPGKPVNLRGQHHVRISNRVNDSLTATVLALESGDGQAVMISQDVCSFNESVLDLIRIKITETCPDLNPKMVFGSATHTHSAPSTGGDRYPAQGPEVMPSSKYGEFAAEKIAGAVKEAWESRSCGGIGYGMDYAAVGFNRRMTTYSGESVMYGNTNDPEFSHIEGDEDHTVNLLTTYNPDGKLTGIVVNVACPSQVSEQSDFVTADYWCEVREEIRSRFGEDIFALPQCGAAGDQSPHMMLNRKAQARMLSIKDGIPMAENERASLEMRMAHRKDIGRRIADAVNAVLPVAKREIQTDIPLLHECITVNLPKRMVTQEESELAAQKVKEAEEGLAKAEEDPTSFDYSRNYIYVRYFGAVVERFKSQKDEPELPMEMHVVRIGDVAFATNRFELFLDYGQRIKARSKAVQTFLVQLAGSGTYLPSQKAVDARSYGAGIESNLVGPEGGRVLVEETVNIINKMFTE